MPSLEEFEVDVVDFDDLLDESDDFLGLGQFDLPIAPLKGRGPGRPQPQLQLPNFQNKDLFFLKFESRKFLQQQINSADGIPGRCEMMQNDSKLVISSGPVGNSANPT